MGKAQQVDKAVALYQSGKNIQQSSSEAGITKALLSMVLHAMGVELRHPHGKRKRIELTPEERTWCETATAVEIGKKYGIHPTTVYRFKRDHKIAGRHTDEAKKKVWLLIEPHVSKQLKEISVTLNISKATILKYKRLAKEKGWVKETK